MSAVISDDLYVSIVPQCKRKYQRRSPKYHRGWTKRYYKVLSMDSDFVAGEKDGHGYVVLCNDHGELWWVSNRDVRVKKSAQYSINLTPRKNQHEK